MSVVTSRTVTVLPEVLLRVSSRVVLCFAAFRTDTRIHRDMRCELGLEFLRARCPRDLKKSLSENHFARRGRGREKEILHGLRELFPPRAFGSELFASRRREPVDAHALAVFGELPGGFHRALALEAMKGRIDQARVHVQHAARCPAPE